MAATTSSVYQVGFPEELAPYAKDLVKQASAFTDITKNPYQQYMGDRVAESSPLQQQAYQSAYNMTPAGQLGTGTDLATAAGIGGLSANYGPSSISTQSFNQPGVSQAYMSPYMQNVVNLQQQDAKRQAAIAGNTMGAQAAQAGAFGGARQAIERAQANRNLQTQLANIQAQGLQSANSQGQQQFNTEQAARMQAQQANEASRQFGANLGMQGLQTGLQSASILGNLGQQQVNQQQDIAKLQQAMGADQQAQAQKILDTQYQDFLNYQNYPYKQMGFLSDILRGAPLTQTGTSLYQSAPTASQSLLSAGLAASGISSLLPKANGGVVGKYADGGITQAYGTGGSVFDQRFKDYAVKHIDPRELPTAARNAQARGDQGTVQAVGDEMAMDAAIRRGIAMAAPNDMDQGYADGGIVAFASGGTNSNRQQVQDLIAKGTAEYTPPSIEDRLGDIKTQRAGLQELYGASEVDPYIQESIAKQEANKADIKRSGTASTLLRMAAALQKSGVNPGDRYAGMYSAAAEGGDKMQSALAAADDSIMKAKIAGATARQARADGMLDKAAAAIDVRDKNMMEYRKNQQTAAVHGAQVIAGIVQADTNAAAHAAVANRPSEQERAQARYEQIASGKADYLGKTGPEAAKQFLTDTASTATARGGERGTKQLERSLAIDAQIVKDPAYAEAAKMASLLHGQTDKKSQEKLAHYQAIMDEIRDKYKTRYANYLVGDDVATGTGGAGSGGPVTVTAGGRTYSFPSQEAADKFKAATAGIK